jgi:phenylacetate-CoA ligase
MDILQKVRNWFFWSLDYLKNKTIKKHYNDISSILENWDSKHSLVKRQKYLSDLLNHAVRSTKFYNNYLEFQDLSDFPVISKMHVKEDFQDMISDEHRDGKTLEVCTSGTTGVPLKVILDYNKKHRNTADSIYFGQKGGYDIGNHLYYIRMWVKETRRNRISLFMTNITEVEVADFSKDFIERFLKKLNKDKSQKNILGYASVLRDIKNFLEKNKDFDLSISISSIISMSEPISNSTKSFLKDYFKVPVISRYSNMENGILAQQIIDNGSDYHINWASYYIEILNIEDDFPAMEGKLGRIVVTDLFNYAMPLIRYDTGDLGIISSDNIFFNKAPVLKVVQGRKMDIIYNTTGELVSSYVAFEMESFHELKQFQLIQNGKKDYCVKLNLEGQFKNEKELVIRLRKSLGQDANISFEYVNEFPQLSSGKRRLTINNYNK